MYNKPKCENPTPEIMSSSSYSYRKNINGPRITPCFRTDEIWLPITYIPNIQNWYYVSNYGKIYSKLSNHLIRPRYIGHGYHEITLRLKSNSPIDQLVHRIVLSVFNPIPNMNEMQVNHINGIKIDNRLINLEWCTCEENISHAHKNGLYANITGEAASFATLTNSQVKIICECLELGLSPREICSKIGLEFTNQLKSKIYQIKGRNNWKHISKDYIF